MVVYNFYREAGDVEVHNAYVGLSQQNEHSLINSNVDVMGSLELVNNGTALRFTLAPDVVPDGGLVVLGAVFANDKKSIDIESSDVIKAALIPPIFVNGSGQQVGLKANISKQDDQVEFNVICAVPNNMWLYGGSVNDDIVFLYQRTTGDVNLLIEDVINIMQQLFEIYTTNTYVEWTTEADNFNPTHLYDFIDGAIRIND